MNPRIGPLVSCRPGPWPSSSPRGCAPANKYLAALGRPHGPASVYFHDALELRAPGFDRVRVMDRVGLAAALFDEGEVEQAATAARQALDDAARIDSALVASRLNTLLDAARPYRTPSVEEVRGRARDLTAARPTTVAA
ncbi:hypothetical protein NFX46_19895 [Streptomyces phaeoluteigriseus]|uniref:Bacterial transcriptional activator domain-containing protein n=1 Tax=Streptomyces phaeoluteigriseus TaxID=114686 RepID=A0ABY4ZA33_9ACTN|nr:hypothetical protein [Streptomyces phaeoluteigriseus]USQ85810.1 hypothetical protein NFX46_19895 [Streptomyces phaeoluteigriseus]